MRESSSRHGISSSPARESPKSHRPRPLVLVFLPLAGLAPSFGAVAASGGSLTARERAMASSGRRDEQDKVLRSAICYRLIQALNMQAKRGNVARLGKQRGVIVWTTSLHLLPPRLTLAQHRPWCICPKADYSLEG